MGTWVTDVSTGPVWSGWGSLLGGWRLAEPTGRMRQDVLSANPLQSAGGSTPSGPGRRSLAYAPAGANGYLIVPGKGSWSPHNIGSLSITLWLKWSISTPTSTSLVCFYDAGGGWTIWTVRTHPSVNTTVEFYTGNSTTPSVASRSGLVDGTWYFFVAEYDFSNKIAYLSMNGDTLSNDTPGVDLLRTTGNSLIVGSAWSVEVYHSFEQLYFFSGMLSQATITAMYKGGEGRSWPG